VSISSGDEIALSARPIPGEGLDALVKRLTDDPRTKKEILVGNPTLRKLRADQYLRVPYRLLSPSFKKVAIEALYPDDKATADGWDHRVSSLMGKPESLWRIAEWLTGDGANYTKIREAGSIASLETREGQVVRIPEKLLISSFREAVAAAAPPAETPP